MAKQSGGNNSAHSASLSTGDPHIATIRVDKKYKVPNTSIINPARLTRLAQEWTYLLRVRSRWASDTELRKSIAERAVKDLATVGVSRERLRELAKADRIEIELHEWDRNDQNTCSIHEAACEVPWEYLLSSGTRAEGRFQSILISRLFVNGLATVTPHPPTSVLFVESAPGRFRDKYEFDDEEKRIHAAVNPTSRRDEDDYWCILDTPQKSELERKVREKNWEAIHITGIDTHQAGWCIEDFYPDLKRKNKELFESLLDSTGLLRDGMILREGHESELPVPYDQLAEILVGSPPPRIVTLNLYYSGARIARELVRKNAHVALGFLDEIDDELAELFFQAFYWNWCDTGTDEILSIPAAFLKTWEAMLPMGGIHGTSIVIWMGRSVFEPGSESIRKTTRQSSSTRNKWSPRKKRAAR